MQSSMPSMARVPLYISTSKPNPKARTKEANEETPPKTKPTEHFLSPKPKGCLEHQEDARGSKGNPVLPSAAGLSPRTQPSSAPCAAPRAALCSLPWPWHALGRSPRWLCDGCRHKGMMVTGTKCHRARLLRASGLLFPYGKPAWNGVNSAPPSSMASLRAAAC